MLKIDLWDLRKQGDKMIPIIWKAIVELAEKYEGRLRVEDPINYKVFPILKIKSALLSKSMIEVKIKNNSVIFKNNLGLVAWVLVKVDVKERVISKCVAEDFIRVPSGKLLYNNAIKIQKEEKENKNYHVIYTSELEIVDKERKNIEESYSKEEIEELGIDINDDESVMQFARENNEQWFEDEKMNLPKDSLNIAAIADIGRWDGRKIGYAEYNCSISELMGRLFGSSIEAVEFYVEGKELKCKQYHHDGKNYITYREITNQKAWDKIKNKLYNQENVSKTEIQRCTRALGEKVAKIYGW